MWRELPRELGSAALTRRRPDFPLDDGPCLVIVIGVEEEHPRVYSRAANPGERARVLDWIRARRDLDDLLRRAFADPATDEVEDVDEEREDDADEREETWGALMFVSYEHWPLLSLRDLQPTDGMWLAEHGIEVENGRVMSWDAEQIPYVDDAEVGDPCFRPGPAFPSSLREIEAVEE